MSSAHSPKSHFSKVLGDGEGGHIHSLLEPDRRFPTMPKTFSLASSGSQPKPHLEDHLHLSLDAKPRPRAPSSAYHPIPNTLDSPWAPNCPQYPRTPMRLLEKAKAPTAKAAERVLTPTTTGPAQKLLLLRVPDEFFPAAFLLGFSAGHGVCSAVAAEAEGE